MYLIKNAFALLIVFSSYPLNFYQSFTIYNLLVYLIQITNIDHKYYFWLLSTTVHSWYIAQMQLLIM